ncbi:FxLYD domain-containing protein [Streptomyces sp. NBC_01356]|uniref:FxLYD domain-containing protein n=1 Tax=Streptomyces sp. NBC_01356 TaxID=2903836 RepID=UPI002E36B3BB|nr:FxLYD domain-containing protein [Streptomyces sp. NBC_01356]
MPYGSPGSGWGAPPPPQPPKRNTGKIVGFGCLGVLLLFVVLGVIGGLVVGSGDDSSKDSGAVVEESTAKASPKETSGPEGDVKITKCEVDSTTSWPAAELLITNRSSKESTYFINVEFVDNSGKRLGEASAGTSNLAPGQKAEETAQGLNEISVKIECKVTEVTRWAS